eukprot:UN33048
MDMQSNIISKSKSWEDCCIKIDQNVDTHVQDIKKKQPTLDFPKERIDSIKSKLKTNFEEKYRKKISELLSQVQTQIIKDKASIISNSESSDDCIARLEHDFDQILHDLDGILPQEESNQLKSKITSTFQEGYKLQTEKLIEMVENEMMKSLKDTIQQCKSDNDCTTRVNKLCDELIINFENCDNMTSRPELMELKQKLASLYMKDFKSSTDDMILSTRENMEKIQSDVVNSSTSQDDCMKRLCAEYEKLVSDNITRPEFVQLKEELSSEFVEIYKQETDKIVDNVNKGILDANIVKKSKSEDDCLEKFNSKFEKLVGEKISRPELQSLEGALSMELIEKYRKETENMVSNVKSGVMKVQSNVVTTSTSKKDCIDKMNVTFNELTGDNMIERPELIKLKDELAEVFGTNYIKNIDLITKTLKEQLESVKNFVKSQSGDMEDCINRMNKKVDVLLLTLCDGVQKEDINVDNIKMEYKEYFTKLYDNSISSEVESKKIYQMQQKRKKKKRKKKLENRQNQRKS